MKLNSFQHQGFGLGLRSCHYEHVLSTIPKNVDWFEVITENFMGVGGKPRRILEEVRSHYPVALHGVGLSVGSDDPLNPSYINSLKELISWLKPFMVSDHLCFTRHLNHNSHDLLPIPYTRKTLSIIEDKINRIQDLIGQRFILENPSAYVDFAFHEMPEWEFLNRLTEATGCGILLDVNNLTVNQLNLGLDPARYIRELSCETVGQIHLAGHCIQTNELGTVRIDTHDHPINNDTWKIFQWARQKWPEASPMIEWDDHIPEFEDLVQMLSYARKLLPETLPVPEIKSETIHSGQTVSLHDQVQPFFSLIVDAKGVAAEDSRLEALSSSLPVPRLLGARVYSNAYFARLLETLKNDFETLAGVTTDDGFAEIAAKYLAHHPPSSEDISRAGQHLPSFLAERFESDFTYGVSRQALSEIARLDLARSVSFTSIADRPALSRQELMEVQAHHWEKISFETTPSLQLISNQFTVAPVWKSIQENTSPSEPENTPEYLIVWRDGEAVLHQSLDDESFECLHQFSKGVLFSEITQHLSQKRNLEPAEAATICATHLIQYFDLNLITGIRI